jgi:heme exporter protein B
MSSFSKISAVLNKELASEFRTRYAISAILLFILTTVTMVLFSSKGVSINGGMAASLLWIILFFASMTGLARSFVQEEERGTSILLKTSTPSYSVYFGKLIYNLLLSITLNLFAVILFFLFIETEPLQRTDIFIYSIIAGSFGFAAATTIISALLAKANTKGALFPILSFPVLLPLIVLCIELTKYAFMPNISLNIASNLGMITAYCGLMVTASYFLFDFVWED